MAKTTWLGRASSIQQVETITIGGTWVAGETATITINGKDITFTVGATATVAAVVAGLVAAWNASTYPEVGEITASDDNPDVVLTGTDGVPFVVTVSEASTSGTISTTTTTAATGPNHWDNADNWSEGSIPGAGDEVFFENSSVSVLYGLDQSAVTVASITVVESYTGSIGLPQVNTSDYREYRDQYLKILCATVSIGTGDGLGSGRIKIDTVNTSTAFFVRDTGAAQESLIPAVLIKTTGNGTLEVQGGTVGFAFHQEDVGTLTGLTVSGGTVLCGPGTTLTGCTLTQSGGRVDTYSAIATAVIRGGTWTHYAGATTAMTVRGGTVIYNGGNITTLNLGGPSGLVDFTQDLTAKTVGTLNINPGANLRFVPGTVAFTAVAFGSDVGQIAA